MSLKKMHIHFQLMKSALLLKRNYYLLHEHTSFLRVCGVLIQLLLCFCTNTTLSSLTIFKFMELLKVFLILRAIFTFTRATRASGLDFIAHAKVSLNHEFQNSQIYWSLGTKEGWFHLSRLLNYSIILGDWLWPILQYWEVRILLYRKTQYKMP